MKALLFFFAVPLFAQYQCASQLKPMKPVGMYCSTGSQAAVSCVCAGNRCGWVWGCGQTEQQQTMHGIDTSIYSQIQPVHVDTPSEIAMRAESLRNMRLQNEALERQLGVPDERERRLEKLRAKYIKEEIKREKKRLKEEAKREKAESGK